MHHTMTRRGAWLTPMLALAMGCAAEGLPPPATAAGPVAPATLVEPGPEEAKVPGLASTIRKVTVYSDRALVTREAAAKVGAEPTVLAFKNLPGWVDDGSVRASITAGRILDVRVGRSYLARSTDPAYRKAEEEAHDLSARMAALADEVKVLEAQAKQVEDVKAFAMEKLPKDVALTNVGVSTYAGVVDFVTKTMRDTAKARRAVDAERERLGPEIEAAKKRVEELKSLTQLEETTVYVTLQGAGAGEARITLSYMLPGATWEPSHEVRVADEGPSAVEVTSYAVVTQASGEDWSHAEITFSTQSSTAAARIPELEALTLGDSRAATQIMERKEASFSRAEAAFRGQNQLWNKRLQAVQQSTNFEEVYRTNIETLQVVQSKTVQIFQSLQQRGTTAQFKAQGDVTVRADGRAVRVPVGHARLQAKQAIVAAPEQSLNAALTLDLRNESGQPLLPGSVALYQAGAFLGMTSVDFVADGESFALFLGVADQLKLARALDKKQSALVRKQRTQMQLAFVVTVENLSPKPVSLTLADRIPVSEEREIVISGVKISPEAKPDSKGILRWPVTLQGRETRKFQIHYTIEYPPTLVLEAKRRQAAEPPSRSPSPMRKAYDLKNDIQKLEADF